MLPKQTQTNPTYPNSTQHNPTHPNSSLPKPTQPILHPTPHQVRNLHSLRSGAPLPSTPESLASFTAHCSPDKYDSLHRVSEHRLT
ncbi:hypothetical protein E2C01_018869 [Portunus trituberculatus]|uniref:Uncharacterized protein n=1 Tax=Portunus trituberculatus TaxID=210409 RepID=A0A5B7DXN3_PORTR|nr:hypothetical protein [Portunus trituberculatus]